MQPFFVSLCLTQICLRLRAITIELLLLPANFSQFRLNLCGTLAVLFFGLCELHLLDFKSMRLLNSMLGIDARLLCSLVSSLVVSSALIELALQLTLN